MVSMLMWIMVQVTFTMNLDLHCLLHLSMSILPSNEDIRLFHLSKSRGNTYGHTYCPFSTNPLGAEPFDYWENLICLASIQHVKLFIFYFIFCFVKFSRKWQVGSDKICKDSHTYVHVLSVHHLYTLPIYLKSHKCEDTFLMHLSHNFTPKRNELRYHCFYPQLYSVGH